MSSVFGYVDSGVVKTRAAVFQDKNNDDTRSQDPHIYSTSSVGDSQNSPLRTLIGICHRGLTPTTKSDQADD